MYMYICQLKVHVASMYMYMYMHFICRFEDLVLSEDDGIPTVEFLESCRAVVPFFG